jgi:hypothetical protein
LQIQKGKKWTKKERNKKQQQQNKRTATMISDRGDKDKAPDTGGGSNV